LLLVAVRIAIAQFLKIIIRRAICKYILIKLIHKNMSSQRKREMYCTYTVQYHDSQSTIADISGAGYRYRQADTQKQGGENMT
jgi:hypothetical protein